jgi:hypothetical protein
MREKNSDSLARSPPVYRPSYPGALISANVINFLKCLNYKIIANIIKQQH